mgnify:CR=1 FL=1
MFHRKKRIVHSISDTKATVYDFQRRFPFENYRVRDYSLYYKLEDSALKRQLNRHLKALLAGDVDAGNANMLDGFLCSLAAEAVADLNLQQCEHQDMLKRLRARRHSDPEDFMKLLNNLRKDSRQLEEEYETVCQMLAANQAVDRNGRKRGQKNV